MKRNVQPELRAAGGGGGIPVDAGCRPPPVYCRLWGGQLQFRTIWRSQPTPVSGTLNVHSPQYNAMRERRNVFARDFHIPGEIHNSGPPSMPGL